MKENVKENATIAGAAAVGAAVGAGAVLGVNSMTAKTVSSQADDLAKENEAEAANEAENENVENGDSIVNNENGEPALDPEVDPINGNGKDYAAETEMAHAAGNSGIQTSQNVNVHVVHREVHTPTEAEVTPEVKVVDYTMQVNADGTTTEVAVLDVDGHNALAIDATGDGMANVLAVDINGDGVYQQDELFDVTSDEQSMAPMREEVLLSGGKITITADEDLVAAHQAETLGDDFATDDSLAMNDTDFSNDANIDDFMA